MKNKLLLATDSKGNTVLHTAAFQGRLDIFNKVWDLAEDNLTTEEMKNKLLLAANSNGNTAWHLAKRWGGLDNLHKIWVFVKDNLTTEEMKNTGISLKH
jgi:ankyrin repeat protein